MLAVMTILALALPLLLGSLWLNLLVARPIPARAALVWGHGGLLGLLLVPQFLLGLDVLGMPLSFFTTASLTLALIVLACVAWALRTRSSAPLSPGTWGDLQPSQRLLFGILLALVIVRVATLGIEMLWRPLFPWDATMHWATKARVWYELGHIAPFVDNQAWLVLNDPGVFTDRHPEYPATIPLLQVWMNLAIGRWDESLMNLPWLLCFAALGCAFYAQLRVAGVGALVAIGFTYLLLSMPLINIHVALAGYADLFLGATYGAALMAFHNWLATRQRWQGVLALIFAALCVVIKNEGGVWALTLLPALAFATPTRHKLAKLLLLCVLLLVLGAILASKNPVLVSSALQHVTALHVGALWGIIQAVWLHDNWHLFGYLLAILLPLGLLLPGAYTRRYLGLLVALTSAFALFLLLFLFTKFGAGASNLTGAARLCVHLFPGLLFLCALIFNDWLSRERLPATSLHTASA